MGSQRCFFRVAQRAAPRRSWRFELANRAYFTASLLGGVTAFHRLSSFQRLELCWRIFGRDRIDGELGQLRRVLGGWGYQLGHLDDPLLPLTVAQLMLANSSPHLQDMTTDLFDRVREQRLLDGVRLNTVHAVQ